MQIEEISDFLNQLQKLGNPDRAVWDQSYHKSKRVHWGVPLPSCGGLVQRRFSGLSEADLLPFAKRLWETDLFDPMMSAIKILSLPRLKPSLALWDALLLFLKKVDGWALEDGLAHVAWKCILAEESLLDTVEIWTEHPDFWMRRAALVYTLPFAKPSGNPERMLKWASKYAGDPEWFIQKAIGWWLRVLGAHNPERVDLFLSAHWKQLQRVAKHEATRKLSSEWQKRILRNTEK